MPSTVVRSALINPPGAPSSISIIFIYVETHIYVACHHIVEGVSDILTRTRVKRYAQVLHAAGLPCNGRVWGFIDGVKIDVARPTSARVRDHKIVRRRARVPLTPLVFLQAWATG